MKKTMLLGLCLIFGLATMMAQTTTPQCDRQGKGQCPQLTTEQKAQLITDRVAKAYDLTADQKAKLLELNLKTLNCRQACKDKGHKPCPKDGQKCDKADQKCDKADKKCDKPCPKDGKKPCAKEGECKKQPQAPGYFKALAEILTPEQLQAYRTDKMIERSLMPQRMARGPQAFRGHCGHKGQAMKECHKHKDGQKCDKKVCKDCKCAGKCAKKACKNCKACKK